MKKILICFITIFCIMTSQVYAQENEPNNEKVYHIPEAKISVQIPSNWLAITPYISKDDPIISKYQIDYDLVQQTMKQQQIVFDAINPEDVMDFTISVMETPESKESIDFRCMPEKYKKKILEKIKTTDINSRDKLAKDMSDIVHKSQLEVLEFYDNDNGLFLMGTRKTQFNNDQGFSSTIAASTIYDSKFVCISMVIYNKDITQENITYLKQLVDKIKLDNEVNDAYNAVKKAQHSDMILNYFKLFCTVALILIVIFLVVRKRKKIRASNNCLNIIDK